MTGPRRCVCGCGAELPGGPNRGEPKKFVNGDHKRTFERTARQVGAATLTDQVHPYKQKRRRGPSRRAQLVSRYVFLALVPVEERAALLRKAAEHLGMTQQDVIEAAMKRNGCLPNRPSAFSLQPSSPMEASCV